MPDKYILAIDEGTTGSRVLIVDHQSTIKGQAYTEFTQYHPAQDRVEHDAEEIWEATRSMISKALAEADLRPENIAAIGITNQRATTVVWDRQSGEPVHQFGTRSRRGVGEEQVGDGFPGEPRDRLRRAGDGPVTFVENTVEVDEYALHRVSSLHAQSGAAAYRHGARTAPAQRPRIMRRPLHRP